MRWITGTATVTGQLSTTKDEVKSVEFHADSDNTGKVRVGTSTTTSNNGRGLEPGESTTVSFDEGSILRSDLYVAFTVGGDKVDWSIVVLP